MPPTVTSRQFDRIQRGNAANSPLDPRGRPHKGFQDQVCVSLAVRSTKADGAQLPLVLIVEQSLDEEWEYECWT